MKPKRTHRPSEVPGMIFDGVVNPRVILLILGLLLAFAAGYAAGSGR